MLWSLITREKRVKKRLSKTQISEHTIEVYLNLCCCIRADLNKRQIIKGKNSSDKTEEKIKGNIPRMIDLRFWIQALPLKMKVWRKADCTYHADEQCFYLPSFKRIFFRSLHLPEFFLVSFFLFNERILLLILLTQTRQFRVFFCCRSIVFIEGLVFEGKAS